MVFIPDAVTKTAVTPESSYEVGRTFGNFQAMLADIPVELGETIKDFHNMEFRLQQMREAVAEDKAGRMQDAEVKELVSELEKRADEMCKAERLHREGKLPKRVCHCDTKVDNMMFDKDGNVLCVIDLDTVMPNYVFSDFGDFLRSAANTGAEDEKDLSKVSFNMDIFKAFSRGYVESAGVFLTPIEVENLPYAAKLFPYMQAVRFLTDYINGDTYYKIAIPNTTWCARARSSNCCKALKRTSRKCRTTLPHCKSKVPRHSGAPVPRPAIAPTGKQRPQAQGAGA